MNRGTPIKCLITLCCIAMSACTGIRHIPSGETLYTGAKINLEKTENTDKKKQRIIKSVAESSIRPEPNKSYWGIRPKMWRYMVAGENPKNKFSKWMKKMGTAPIFMSGVKPGITASIIDAQLFNIGVFHSYTEYMLLEKKHTTKILYTIYIHKPFTLSNITHTISDQGIHSIVQSKMDNTLLKPGQDYNLETLKKERQRIDALLKDNGYFYFNPDYLQFLADTSSTNQTVSLRLILKDSIPDNALTAYRIKQVYIDQEYTLREASTDSLDITFNYKGVSFRGEESKTNIRPKVLIGSVFLKKGDTYSRQNHNQTLNRLMSMGNYKFVQMKFSNSDTNAAGFLDVRILLTPMTNRTFRAELDLVTKSNSFSGPRLNVSLLNRNTFKGAELLNLTLAGSYEVQLSRKTKNLYSYSLNPQLELSFPRFILPFKMKKTNSIYVPRTQITLAYNYSRRVNYFDMKSLQLSFGYKWKENIRKEHELSPINISYTIISKESDEFRELLLSNPILKKSYEELFIAGLMYAFTYNEQVIPAKKTQYFLLAMAETAGNTFTLLNMARGENPSQNNPSTLIGSVYAQYAKLSGDGRVYYNLRNNNKIAIRAFAGVAKPYMNSSVLPYSKLFFSGGPNSIRAFAIHSLGPGKYNQDNENVGFLQLGGDIKLEMNAELRFNIYRFFKGALFMDAGNVWLHKSNPLGIGNPFMFSRFMDDLAIGAGLGVRIDVSFFILRFDLAMPLRKPWLEDKNGWVTQQINLGDASWRNENLRLNIAIGYPF